MKRHWLGLAVAIPLLAQSLRVDVNLVRVPCFVTDRDGTPVRGLGRDQFVVLEDGVPQEIKYLWQELDLPLTVGLVADVSGSQTKFVEQHRETILQFLARVLSPSDRAFLVSVANQQTLMTDFTDSLDNLRAGVEALGRRPGEILGEPCTGGETPQVVPDYVCGGTALWNGIFFSARLKMRPQPGRKALLVITDGMDTGSDHGLVDAIEACQGADTVVYSIRYLDANAFMVLSTKNPLTWLPNKLLNRELAKINGKIAEQAKRDLERISFETGGVAFEGDSANLPEVFGRIEADLRSQYVLGYTAREGSGAQRYHKIQVKVTRPGLTVRARQGYNAQ
jgi:VWFA-related protein